MQLNTRTNLIPKSRRKYQYTNKFFIKTYPTEELAKIEFLHGRVVKEYLPNYVAPQKYKNKKIFYPQVHNLKTLKDLLVTTPHSYRYIVYLAAYLLSQLHNNELIHGDWSIDNIAIEMTSHYYRILIIDASFTYFCLNKLTYNKETVCCEIFLFPYSYTMYLIKDLRKLNIKRIAETISNIYLYIQAYYKYSHSAVFKYNCLNFSQRKKYWVILTARALKMFPSFTAKLKLLLRLIFLLIFI